MFFIPILSAILFLLCSLLLCSLFFLSSFSGRYYRPLFPSPPFAARPLHPPRLADRAALSFPPFVERSYSPGDTIAPSHPLIHSPSHPLTLPLPCVPLRKPPLVCSLGFCLDMPFSVRAFLYDLLSAVFPEIVSIVP